MKRNGCLFSIVLFSKKISNGIDIGSTRVSRTSFWVGIGVVEEEGGRSFRYKRV